MKHKKILILISIFLAVKLLFMTRVHSVIWDEAVYLAMGKFIYSFGSVGLWEIVRPIGLPLIFGFIWKIGLDQVVFSEIFIILIGAGYIFLVYLIGSEVWDKHIGLLAALFAVITPGFFLYSSYLLTGVIATFFVLLALYFYLKKRLVLCGIFSALGFLFRFPLGLFLVVVVLALVIDFRQDLKALIKKLFVYLISFFIITLPYLTFNYFMYYKETSKWWHAAFRPFILGAWAQFNPAEGVNGALYSAFYYPIILFVSNVFLVLSIYGLVLFFKKKLYKNYKFNIILIGLIVNLLYFSYITNKQVRFMVVFLPYIALFSGYGLVTIARFFNKKRIAKFILYAIVILILVLIINVDLSYYLWRPKSEPLVVTDYYKYFLDKEIKGPILTTDPVPAVYVDAEFIPIYFSIGVANKEYGLHRNDLFAIIYSPDHFYCGDEVCTNMVASLTSMVEEDNELAFSTIYNGKNYYIYTT